MNLYLCYKDRFTLIGENISTESLSTHFNRIQFKKRPKDTATWIDFRMEHTLPWKDIQHKLGRWLNYRNYGLYPRKIQEAEEATVGWLLWSFREIDANYLATVLQKDYGISVGLRWSVIRTGRFAVSEDAAVRALHVITTAAPEEQERVSNKLKNIYHTIRTSFPLGIRLRFIATPKGLDYSLINKIKRCRRDQNKCINNLEHERYDGIDQLDSKSGDLTTLREQIMKIKSPANNDQSLFVSVNQQFNNPDKVVFSFRKRDADTARAMIPALHIYIINSTQNKGYGQYFNRIAKLHSKNFSWDEDNKNIITKADSLIPDETIDTDLIFWGLDEVLDSIEVDNTTQDDRTINTSNTNIDNMSCSVKTFTTGKNSQQITGKFDDASTIASANSTDTEGSLTTNTVPHTISTISNLKRELTKLTNSVTLLKVNDKTRADESKSILGKLEKFEKAALATTTDKTTGIPFTTPSGSTS